ncbi:hypothetical protein RRG08_013199 [Elysia crispata]|uniref:Uncharacterized protein n=1 Tax=Elysia crispata TaxID=231223 RepID=A0AAE1E9H9_9GAST|nr:hypothetical protein RRG08_013199 [Elysia crispata]
MLVHRDKVYSQMSENVPRISEANDSQLEIVRRVTPAQIIMNKEARSDSALRGDGTDTKMFLAGIIISCNRSGLVSIPCGVIPIFVSSWIVQSEQDHDQLIIRILLFVPVVEVYSSSSTSRKLLSTFFDPKRSVDGNGFYTS